MPMHDTPRTKVRKNTIIDCLPYFSIYMLVSPSPIMDPKVLHPAIQRAKLMQSSWFRKYIRQAAILLKVTRYMPVAEETFGGTPIDNSKGLNMDPPPSPSAPATQPPANAKKRTSQSVLPSNLKSLSTKFVLLNFFLSVCSLATILHASRTTQP